MIKQIAKYLIISFFVFLTISCGNNREINGFYYGKNGEIPVLVNYNQGYYINYFAIPYDTSSYKRTGDEYHFKMNYYNLDYNLRIVQKGQILNYYLNDSDTLLYKLQKSKSSNYILDQLDDKEIKIDLPSGNGKTEILGHEFRIHNPLYITKDGKDVLVNFNNKTTFLNENFYQTLNSEQTIHRPFPITLIADQNLPIKELKNLQNHLKIAGYEKINFILFSKDYEKVNYFTRRIQPYSKTEIYESTLQRQDYPPIPPTLISENNQKSKEELVIQHVQNNWKLNNSPIRQLDLMDQIANKIKSNPDLTLINSINFESTYKEYIEVLDVINTIYSRLRKEYLKEKYGSDYIDIYNHKNKIVEAEIKYPIRLVDMNSTDP